VVLGDLNDTKDARSTRAVLGRSNSNLGLVDTRPSERPEARAVKSEQRWANRQVTWTHHYGKEDSYSRLDYILLSKGMAREWVPEESCVLVRPDWGVASDHRPIVAVFTAEDR